MTKVCHISDVHPRYDSRILYRECVSLKENGYEVSYIVNDNIKNEEYKGVKIKSTGKDYKGKRIKRMIFGIREVYKLAMKEQAELYHLHDPELLLLIPLLKKRGKKVIFDSHECYYLQIQEKYYIPKILRKLMASIYHMIETILVGMADAAIIPSTIAGKHIFKNRAKRERIINNVPKLDEIPLQINRKNVEINKICYSGSLSYDRGILHLIHGAYKAKVTLALAGRFNSEEFREKVEKEKLYSTVEFYGFLSRQEIYELYETCNIGMCTLLDIGQYSKGDNLPTKVYEYMAMGMPVILSDFPYYKKMVKKYHFGITVNPTDTKQIADAIKYLIEHPKKSEQMGENGRKVILEKFNWNIEEKKLFQLYKEVLNDNKDKRKGNIN